MWSPSRQLGSFFVYRQMSVKVPRGRTLKDIEAMACPPGGEWVCATPQQQAEEKPYVGSLLTSSTYARDGLVKKTLAVGTTHVISYFTIDDVLNDRLLTPSNLSFFDGLSITPELRKLVIPSSASSASSTSGVDFQTDLGRPSATSSRETSSGPRPALLAPQLNAREMWHTAIHASRGRATSLPGPQCVASVPFELSRPSPPPLPRAWPGLRLQPVPVALPFAAGSSSGREIYNTADEKLAHCQTDHSGTGEMGSASEVHIIDAQKSSHSTDTSRQPAPNSFHQSSQALAARAPRHSLLVASSSPSTSMWPIEPSPYLQEVQDHGTFDDCLDPALYAGPVTYSSYAGSSHSIRSARPQELYIDATPPTHSLDMLSSQVPSGLAAGRLSVDYSTFHPSTSHYSDEATIPWYGPGEHFGYGSQEHPSQLQGPRITPSAGTPFLDLLPVHEHRHYASPQLSRRELQHQQCHSHLSHQVLEQHNFEHSREQVNRTWRHF